MCRSGFRREGAKPWEIYQEHVFTCHRSTVLLRFIALVLAVTLHTGLAGCVPPARAVALQ